MQVEAPQRKGSMMNNDSGRAVDIVRKVIVMSLAVCSLAFGRLVIVGGQPPMTLLHKTVHVSVNDPRPVAAAVLELEKKYGRIITYEDPRLVHATDLLDVTEAVRRDLANYPSGKAPRVIGPKGGQINFEYNETASLGTIIRKLLSMPHQNSARFRMEEGNGIIHIIPKAIKNRSGELATTHSVLDYPVNVPELDRNGIQTLKALCAAISDASGIRVVVGTIPTNLFLRYKDQKGASAEKGRDFLVKFLQRAGAGTKLSWRLLYDPGMKMYALNVHTV
jgi:hypothetical protein